MDAQKAYTKSTTAQMFVADALLQFVSFMRSSGITVPSQTQTKSNGTKMQVATASERIFLFVSTPKIGAMRMKRMEDVATAGVVTNDDATCDVKTATTRINVATQKNRKIWRPA